MSALLMPWTSTTSRSAVRSQQMDLRQPRADDVDVRRLVVVGVDHEPEAVGAVDDDYGGG